MLKLSDWIIGKFSWAIFKIILSKPYHLFYWKKENGLFLLLGHILCSKDKKFFGQYCNLYISPLRFPYLYYSKSMILRFKAPKSLICSILS